MRLEWTMLANHAESPNGLLFISGGGWDTVVTNGAQPPFEAGEGPAPVALIQGVLIAMLSFTLEDAKDQHSARIVVVDETAGVEFAAIEVSVGVAPNPDSPEGWTHRAHLIVPLTGIPLMRFGTYTLRISVDDEILGSAVFRVVSDPNLGLPAGGAPLS